MQARLFSPAELGIGARVTVAAMTDDYVAVLTDALHAADAAVPPVVRETDAVSSFVRGTEQEIVDYLAVLLAAAGGSGRHVSASILLSRGCPGELHCEVPPDHEGAADSPVLRPTGQFARGQWSLYPLADGASGGAAGGASDGASGDRPADHMRTITEAIELSKSNGTFVGTRHFVTELAGDVADVLMTVASAWVSVGRTVQHTVCHLTLSLNSPGEQR
ncbi:YkoF family thiamine/hydroxymethylpyrimidine-binding protein [Nakamurella sp. GG22]